MPNSIRRIISGAQTGADRAALDVAIELAIDHGGWVPAGRWTEDGRVAACYQVRETESAHVAARTEANVREADATLILTHGALSGGSALTAGLARRHAKPWLHVDLAASDETQGARAVLAWLREVQPQVLNVAGPRASSDPLIYDATCRVLRSVLS